MSVRPSSERQPRPLKMNLGGKPSGLRSPSRAMRGLGAMALSMEALVLLLAILPLGKLQNGIPTAQLAVILGSVIAAILLTGLLRKPIGWWLGLALQGVLILGVILHWVIGVVGVTFAMVWIYVLYVRRRVML